KDCAATGVGCRYPPGQPNFSLVSAKNGADCPARSRRLVPRPRQDLLDLVLHNVETVRDFHERKARLRQRDDLGVSLILLPVAVSLPAAEHRDPQAPSAR